MTALTYVLALSIFTLNVHARAQTVDLKKGQDGRYIHLKSLDYRTPKPTKPSPRAPEPTKAEIVEPLPAIPLLLPTKTTPEILTTKPEIKTRSDKLPNFMLGYQYLFSENPHAFRDHQFIAELLLASRSTLGVHLGTSRISNDASLSHVDTQQFGLQLRSYHVFPLYAEAAASYAQGDHQSSPTTLETVEFSYVDFALGVKIKIGILHVDLRFANLRYYQNRAYISEPNRSMLGPAGIGLGIIF